MRKLLLAFLFCAVSANAQSPVRIHCGGDPYTDSAGQVWAQDANFTTGGHGYYTTHAITGTANQPLFQTERWNTGHLTYTFTLPNGSYHVNISLAEIYFGSAGTRVINIALQGMPAFTGIDIFKEVGQYAALVKSADATVSSGTLVIDLTATADNPKCSAIEILPGGPPAPYQFVLSSCCTITFPIANASQVPTCTKADGVCSITLQITCAKTCTPCDSAGACFTGVGTLALVKTVTLPVPQTLTIPVAVASP